MSRSYVQTEGNTRGILEIKRMASLRIIKISTISFPMGIVNIVNKKSV